MSNDLAEFPSQESSPSPHIRRPTLHDLNECLLLDASYVTQRVWQMNLRVDNQRIQVDFQLVHLPRKITITAPPSTENMLKRWQQGDCMFSARHQHDVVGFLHLVAEPKAEVGYIRRHVVAPELRGQGIGGALLQRALQWGRDHKLRSVVVNLSTKNYPASAFYLAHGFAFCGFNEELHGEQQILLQFARSVR